MATIPTVAGLNSKAGHSLKASSTPFSGHQLGASSAHDSLGQRRFGGSSGGGIGTRPLASGRNSQNKRQHKSTKRFRLDDDAIAEQVTMRSTTSRKGQTSITHLMNFASPPRAYFGNYRNSNYRHDRKHGYSALDKTRYVHANYRFIVDPRLEYHAQSTNADEYIDWQSVLQVIASSQSQADSCPICLDLPAAPRMAKCGHIFCLQCLVRFMAAEEEQNKTYDKKPRSKKCPLCWESIYISEVRPVRWYTGNEDVPPREGSDICLRLIKRRHGSTLALPRDGADTLVGDDDIPWYFAAEVMDYAHIMKGTEEYMLEQLDKDIIALDLQEKENELMFGDDTAEWTKKAMRLLREHKEKLQGIGGPLNSDTKLGEKKTIRSANIDVRPSEVTTGANGMSTIQAVQRRFESSGPSSQTEYYFYQGLRHYYLSPLDIRILKEAFGSFATFPATILPRIERISTGHVVDDDLRKRSKWLSHLPSGCEVCFLECDWTDTVQKEILDKFSEEINRRRKRNEDKDATDERARVKAERDEDNKRYAGIRRRIPDEAQPNWFGNDEHHNFDQHDHGESSAPSATPPWGNRATESPFNSLANMSTSPSASRTVWGTAVVPGADIAANFTIEGPSEDGWLQNWERDLLHEENDLVVQAQALSLVANDIAKTSNGKKKKAKKITLMSTNVRRGA